MRTGGLSAIEERYLADVEREKAHTSEMHRLAYVYFLRRLTDALRGSDAERAERAAEIHEIARVCRRERARHLGITEAEADRRHGTVVSLAEDTVRHERWAPS